MLFPSPDYGLSRQFPLVIVAVTAIITTTVTYIYAA